MMKKIALLALVGLFLCGCAGEARQTTPVAVVVVTPAPTAVPTEVPSPTPEPTPSPEEIEMQRIQEIIAGMTLEEQVCQLFIITLGPKRTPGYAEPNEDVMDYVHERQPGGYVLFPENITTVEATRALAEAVRAESAIAPFIAIDEEGGRVSRLRSAGLPGYDAQPTARSIRDAEEARAMGEAIGRALVSIGVNLDFAPVVDVLTESSNGVIGNRAFGTEAQVVADLASGFQRGLTSQGVLSALKHFPGHGGTVGDSHEGSVHIPYDRRHLEEVEFPPFVRLIDEGAAFVLVGHIQAPALDDSGLPATLSHTIVTDVLRGELGFEGVVVTDAMDMGAIAQEYTSEEAAVLAIRAGIDVILMPANFQRARDGILQAVEDGEISRERIEESLVRILRAKIRAGVIE